MPTHTTPLPTNIRASLSNVLSAVSLSCNCKSADPRKHFKGCELHGYQKDIQRLYRLLRNQPTERTVEAHIDPKIGPGVMIGGEYVPCEELPTVMAQVLAIMDEVWGDGQARKIRKFIKENSKPKAKK